MPPKAANAQSSQAALKALELNDMLAEAHAMMAVLRASEYDWKGAEREFRRALELDPQSEDVWSAYDYSYLVPMRRLDEAVAASRRALELDPLSPFLHFRLGYRYWLTRQWDRAIEQCRNALELDPHYAVANLFLGGSYALIGKLDEAIRSMETYAQLMGRSPMALGWLGSVYVSLGRIGEARKLLEELQELAQKTYVQPFSPLCAAQREFCSRYVLRPIRFYGSQRSEFTWKCKFFDLRATRIGSCRLRELEIESAAAGQAWKAR